MVGVLVRLRWRLLVAGVRNGGPGSSLSLWLAFLAAVTFGLFAVVGLAAVRTGVSPDEMRATVVGAGALLWAGWGIGPVSVAGAQTGLEVDKLATFPLRRTELTLGCAAAYAVGPGGAFSLLTLVGLVVAASHGAAPVAAVVDLPAVLVLFATCVVTGRLVSAAVAGAAKRRRWRDLALVLGPLIAVSVNVVFQVASRASQEIGHVPHWAIATLQALRWTPPGMTAEAMVDAGQGHLALAVAWLALAIAVLGQSLIALARLTDRALAASTDRAVGARRSGGTGSLFRGALRVLPRTRRGVLLARELRLVWRDPRRRVEVFTSIVPMAGALAPSLHGSHPESVLAASVPAFIIAASSTNVFGFDARARWIDVAAGDDALGDLLVKVTARIVVAAVPTVVVAAVLTVLAGSAAALAPAMALAVAGFGVGILPALGLSITLPVPFPDDGRSPFARGGAGRAARQVGPSLAIFLGGGIVLGILAAVSYAVRAEPAGRILVASIDVVLGTALVAATLTRAAARLGPRQPELLMALTRS